MNSQTSGCMRQLSLEEDAALGRDRRLVAEQVLEDGGARAARVRALRHLRELQRIAEQDQVPGGRPDRDARRRARPGRPRR